MDPGPHGRRDDLQLRGHLLDGQELVGVWCPTVTSLRPRDVVACLRSNLWDEASGRMVSYRDAAASPVAPANS